MKQSKYHIIIEPNLNGLDKYLIQEIIHEYTKSKLLVSITNNKIFRIVIINKIDNLSYYTQTSLRRIIEMYSNTCKFILLCDNLSKLIEPLRSQCLLIRIPVATNLKILDIILFISNKENINVNGKQLFNIINDCDNNINNAIWLLDTIKYNVNYKNKWLEIIDNIVYILQKENLNSSKKLYNSIKLIKEKFYLLFITNINTHLIIRKIMIKLLEKTTNLDIKYKIINITSIFEQRLNKGTRHIIHIEAYIIELIKLYISHN
jgi:replication factor C subunit 3/5